jgi:hypothetical protein
VPWYRNIFSYVPATKVREIATMLKAIHAKGPLWRRGKGGSSVVNADMR